MPNLPAQLPAGCVWELEVRPQSDSGAWRGLGAQRDVADVTADGLTPGTKYVFRARAGLCLSASTLLLPTSTVMINRVESFKLRV